MKLQHVNVHVEGMHRILVRWKSLPFGCIQPSVKNRICPMDFLFRARGIRCGCVFCWIVSRRFFSQNPQFFLKTVVKLLPAHNIDFPVFQWIVGPEFRVAVRRQAPIDAIETLFRHQQRTNAFVLTRQAPMTYAVVQFAPTPRTRTRSK